MKRAWRQRGVAIVPALLLATLAVTVVSGLFWRQQVQVRTLENQRLALQAHWVALGAIDWAQRTLQDDARSSAADHLGEPWAAVQPVTRLDGYLGAHMDDADASQALLSSHIVDAQSFFNLSNLVSERQPNAQEMASFRRLLASLHLDPGLAQGVASALAATQKGVAQPGNAPPPRQLSDADKEKMSVAEIREWEAAQAATAETPASIGPTSARLLQLEDLLQQPGFTREVIAKLRAHAIFLPGPAPLNANTAEARALAAVLGKDLGSAAQLVAARKQAWFRDEADLALRSGVPANPARASIKTHYFLLQSEVRVGRADIHLQALIERSDDGKTRVAWLRES
jgi:general secretion pathway protein K